jgi:hypothetical protein
MSETLEFTHENGKVRLRLWYDCPPRRQLAASILLDRDEAFDARFALENAIVLAARHEPE